VSEIGFLTAPVLVTVVAGQTTPGKDVPFAPVNNS
jgi:hypothetical protein